jgi:hypothetical protein
MDSLRYIQEKFNLDFSKRSPIFIPITKYEGLPNLFQELGFKVGAEIGVARSKYSKWLCHQMRRNKPKLFLVDPYLAYKDFGIYADQAGQDARCEEARARMAKYDCEFIKKPSMEAVKDFKDGSLDFVYIDANHTFEYVVNDIAEWSKKIRSGGIISGHDYSSHMFEVKGAVDAWVKVKNIKPWFLTEHRNWFYVI